MTLTQCWSDAGPKSATLAQHQTSTGSTPRVCWAAFNPVNTKHYCSVSFVKCFRMFRKSKKLQVRNYLFKWTELFCIQYVRSWVVGLPNHPQLQNYMTLSIMVLFTPCDFWRVADLTNVDPMLFQCRTNVVANGPAWSITLLWHPPSLYPAKARRWKNIGLIPSWQWTNVSQHWSLLGTHLLRC